jgi:hypothetical protein
MEGEVILADSASSDRTIEIAANYPIKIVRLKRAEDRSCGAGTQLGYQYSSGNYICHIDADMRLHREFLACAIRFLENHLAAAGVGGHVIDRDISNLEFDQRVNRGDPDRIPGRVSRLDGAGVYRRSAIKSVGYLTDRNLHGGEELELAGRLHSRGWALVKLDQPAVDHFGHPGSAYRLLMRRVMTRNSLGPGEGFRAALGRRHFGFMLRNDRLLLICVLVFCWWAGIGALATSMQREPAIFAAVGLFLLPFAAMAVRWQSLRKGIYSVAAWNTFAMCFLPGLLRRRLSPGSWIDSVVVKDIPVPPWSPPWRDPATASPRSGRAS